MNRNKFVLFYFLLPFILFGIESQPWFGNPYEFNFVSEYSYSYYSKIDSSIPSDIDTSHDHLLYFDLEFPYSTSLSMDIDLELIDTPRQSFGFRSAAFQLRYLFLDDVVGDPLSLAVGGNIRGVNSTSVKDYSCPYHGEVNVEATISLGKEISSFEYWKFRIWGLGALGFANRGSPWLRAILAFDGNVEDRFKYSVFLEGQHGYGRRTRVYLDRFKGYGHIRHENIDLGLRIGKSISVYGTLIFEYRRRVYAKRFPENVNFFEFSFLLPFSF